MAPKRLEADDVSASREAAAAVVVVVVAGGHVSLSLSLTESEACLCCHSKLHSFTLLLRTRSPNHFRTACCCIRRVWHYISCQSPFPPPPLLMHNRRAFPGAGLDGRVPVHQLLAGPLDGPASQRGGLMARRSGSRQVAARSVSFPANNVGQSHILWSPAPAVPVWL